MEVVAKMNDEVNLDLELKNERRANFRDRIWFIKYWVKFIKTHPDEEWSKGQATLIDSQIKSVRDFYKNVKNPTLKRRACLGS